MGNQPSTQDNKRRNNDAIVQMRHQAELRQSLSSSKRLSKSEQKVRDIEIAIKELKRAIEAYDGIRGTPNYKALHSQLSRKGQEVQELLIKSTKSDKQNKYKSYQKEINNLFKLLEEKVEMNERQLDSAAIESHSFISPKPADYSKQNSLNSQKSEKSERPEKLKTQNSSTSTSNYETNLDEVEQRATILEDEINCAISLEDRSKYKLLEQKLNMLYSDLTKIEDSGTKNVNRKDSINKSLMRQAKKLQNVKQDKEKRGSQKKSIDSNERSKEERATILKIEEELSDVEVKVLTFEDLKSDPKYRELDQILKGYWANLSNLNDSTEENRRRKLKTIDLIKKMLQELAKRAEENSTKINNALDKINDIEDEIFAMKNTVEKFRGLRNDHDYNSIDQKLRSLWAKLNDIHNNYEAVINRKEETVQSIQILLKNLLEIAEKNDLYANRDVLKSHNYKIYNENDERDEIVNEIVNKPPIAAPRESSKSYLLEDLEEFENKWVVLDKSIRNNLKYEEKDQIREIIESLEKNFAKTLLYLNQNLFESKSSLRISTGNVAKISSSPLLYANSNNFNNSNNSNNSNQNINVYQQEKVVVKEKQLESISKVKSSENLDREGRNMTPPERLIAELTASNVLTTLNTIEHDSDILKKKILSLTLNLNQNLNQNLNLNQNQQEIDENFASFKKDLENLYLKVDNLEICQNPTVIDQKNKVYQKLSEINIILNTKLRKDVHQDTNKLKTIVENVQKLKKKVDCFAGTYKNVLYVNIEDGLNECLKELDEIVSDNDKINKTKEQLSGKILRYIEILDERSLKVHSQEDLSTQNDSSKEIEKDKVKTLSFSQNASNIVNNLTKIRSTLEKFDGNLTESVLIEIDVKKCQDDIKNLNPKTEDQFIIQNQYFDYLQKLILYFESHKKSIERSSNSSNPSNSSNLLDLSNAANSSNSSNSTTGKTLILLENELTHLKDEITRLNAIESDAEFEKTQLELDDLLVRVNSVEILTQNEKEFKNNLQGSIQSLNGLLKTKRRASKRMSQYNEQLNQVKLEEVQEAIGKLSDEVYNFNERNYRKKYDELDEEMANIFLKIQGLEIDHSMRDYLIRQIQGHKKVLQQKLQDINVVKRGTEV